MTRAEFYSNLMNYQKVQNDPDAETIKHYGIIGQKWGQRRWQNADGTFNTEGKIRYFGSQKAQAEKMQNEKVGGFGFREIRTNEKNLNLRQDEGPKGYQKIKPDQERSAKELRDMVAEEFEKVRMGGQDSKIGFGIKGKTWNRGNDIGTGEHLHEIHELKRQINEFEDAGLDTKSLEKMLKYYEEKDGYKYGSQPGNKQETINEAIKGIFSKKNNNLSDKIREQAKELRKVGEDDLADKYEAKAKELDQYKKIGSQPGMSDEERKATKRACANCWKVAMRNKWPLFLLFGILGGGVIGAIASNSKINKMIDQLGLDRQDKDKFTADDWDKITEAIKDSRRKKPKNAE